MKQIHRAATVLSLSVSAFALAHSAQAQVAPAQNPVPGSGPNNGGVEEIIVRAQRTEQSLQKVPVSVTPVTAKDLETKRLHDISQLTLAVPSLGLAADNTVTLRGIGSEIFSANVDSSVGIMVDNVSLGVPIFMSNAAFVDIDQVEALTGPQGLLFGRNSSAGLINVITAKPRLNVIEGSLNVEYDNRDAPGGHFGIVATGVLNVPTSGNSALRLNVLESDQDPITRELVNVSPNYQGSQKRLMGKAKWLWEPTSDLSIYVIGDYSRERGVGGTWDETYRTTGAGGQDAGFATHDGVTPGPTNFYAGVSGGDFRSVDTGGVSLTVNDKLSSTLSLSNIVAWRHYTLNYNLDSDLSSINGLDTDGGHQVYNQYSEELRLAYKDDKLDGQVGVYGFTSTNHATGDFLGAGGFGDFGITDFVDGHNAYDLTQRSLAAYGQFAYHATDKFQLIAGARVTNDHNTIDASVTDMPVVAFSPPLLGFLNQLPFVNVLGPNQAYSATADKTNFSYKLGAQYNVTPGTMVYATWSTGYKGPALKTNLQLQSGTATGLEDPHILPETVKDLEVGIKAKMFDNKLRLNIAGFIEKFHNFQVQAFNSGGIATETNANGVIAKGVEINSTFKPIAALTFNYNATLEDSHFTSFPNDPCYIGQGCTEFEAAGVKTPTSAKYTGTFEAVYSVPVGSGKVDLEGNWYHRSSVNFSANGSPAQELGAVNVFGASLTYRMDKGINVSVFCKNCFNKIYPNYIGADPLDGSAGVLSTYQQWGYNSVRTIGASLGFKF